MDEDFQNQLTASTRFFMPKHQLAEYINMLINAYSGKGVSSHVLDQYIDILVDCDNPRTNWVLETVASLQILFVCASRQITGHELDGTQDTNYPYHSKSGENMALFHYFSIKEQEDWWIIKIDTQDIQRKTYGVYKEGCKTPVFCYINLEELINRTDVRLDTVNTFIKLNQISQLKSLFQ